MRPLAHQIHYTLDGSTPSNTASTLYTAPFLLFKTTTVKAIALSPSADESAVAVGTFTVTPPLPTFTPVQGIYAAQAGGLKVTMSDTLPGTKIYYTVDGSSPIATAGTLDTAVLYSAPIYLTETTTIKATAEHVGYSDSTVVTENYIVATLPAPTYSPVAGSYSGSQQVTLSDTDSTVTIFYTTDGSTPTKASTKYTGAITVSKTTTINAIAWAQSTVRGKPVDEQSTVTTAKFTISP